MTIKEKLLAIQCELKAPKNQYNNFGKYKYRSCEDVLEALKPLCGKYKAVLTINDEVVTVGDRYYLKTTVTLSDTETEESISTKAFAREEEKKAGMDGSQITGSASSYARKYALNALFAIDDTKDADATNKNEEEKATDKQIEILANYYHDENLKKLLDTHHLEKLEDIPKSLATRLIGALKNRQPSK